MSVEKMREEFEEVFRSQALFKGMSVAALDSMLERGSDGEYRSVRVHGAWWGWQESRAAIEVELPEWDGAADLHFSTPVMSRDAVLAAIEAAGLKVKGEKQ